VGSDGASCGRRPSTKQDQSEPAKMSALSVLYQGLSNCMDPVVPVQKHAQETRTFVTDHDEDFAARGARSRMCRIRRSTVRSVLYGTIQCAGTVR
jgi:hypothetical protein